MGKSIDHSLRQLVRHYQKNARVLPWREDPSPYRVWLSEIMLQQTQVVTVVGYFERFIARFSNVNVLANASESDVLALWSGLGYYSRARNIHRAAQILKNGFPSTREEWLEIPGVGPYTAGAILSIAFQKPEALLDGNVERVLSRVFAIRERSPKTKARLWKESRRFVERGYALKLSPSHINQALMETGAMICTPKKPKCGECAFESICEATRTGTPEAFPEKKKRAETVKMTERRDFIFSDRGIWVEKTTRWQKGLYDLPSLPKEKSPLGLAAIRYQVTHHRILRSIVVSSTKKKSLSKTGQWVRVASDLRSTYPEVPITGSLKKSIRAVLEAFPGVKPAIVKLPSATSR